MFTKLRELIKGWFVSGISWLTLGQQAYAVYRLSQSYPGVSDSGSLRSWILSALGTGGDVAKLTETEVDDNIIETAVKVVNDEDGWTFIYSLLVRAGSLKDIPEKWNEPESAATIIAAIGLLVQLISKIREKRQENETAEIEAAKNKIENSTKSLQSADGVRSLGDQTETGTKKNARILFEKYFGRPMSCASVLGDNCGTELNAEVRNFVLATILWCQKECGRPVITARTNLEHDEILRECVRTIAQAKADELFKLTKDIMQFDGGVKTNE